MIISTTTYVEHKNGCGQEVLLTRLMEAHLLVPGASTCCAGCSSTSCCSCGALGDALREG
jgi:hypothetical protein